MTLPWAGKNAQPVQISLKKVELFCTFCDNLKQPDLLKMGLNSLVGKTH